MNIFEWVTRRFELVLERRVQKPNKFWGFERPSPREVILDFGRFSLMLTVFSAKGMMAAAGKRCALCASLAAFMFFLGASSETATATSRSLFEVLKWVEAGPQ